jgi:hypothetical protein
MQPLEVAQLQLLNSYELALRIDAFFHEDRMSRYGENSPSFGEVLAADMLNTNAMSALPEPSRKRSLQLFYRARFQSALCLQYAGVENSLVHLDRSDEKWSRPKVQIMNAAMRQAMIVSARIAFECLMEFVYFVENGTLIPSAKSKRGSFRKWCCRPGNRFGWMVFYLLIVSRFDREHRSPEVHGTSYVAVDALRCNVWPRLDGELDALNLMQNIWTLVRQTMNAEVVSGFHSFSQGDGDIFKEFFRWNEIDLSDLWDKHA